MLHGCYDQLCAAENGRSRTATAGDLSVQLGRIEDLLEKLVAKKRSSNPLGQCLDCLIDATSVGVGVLCLIDPRDVLAPMAEAQRIERRCWPFAFFRAAARSSGTSSLRGRSSRSTTTLTVSPMFFPS